MREVAWRRAALNVNCILLLAAVTSLRQAHAIAHRVVVIGQTNPATVLQAGRHHRSAASKQAVCKSIGFLIVPPPVISYKPTAVAAEAGITTALSLANSLSTAIPFSYRISLSFFSLFSRTADRSRCVSTPRSCPNFRSMPVPRATSVLARRCPRRRRRIPCRSFQPRSSTPPSGGRRPR